VLSAKNGSQNDKKVEAEGIRGFQQIVSQGISDSYLRWRGIEATLQLSQSTNSKVVIIGSAKDGLPIILGNLDTLPSLGAGGPRPKAVTQRSRKRLRQQAQQYHWRRRLLRRYRRPKKCRPLLLGWQKLRVRTGRARCGR
jgi:hypothetical protein